MIHNIDEATTFGINGSFWSIAVEFQLYLIYPILILFIAKWGWRWTLLLLFAMEVLIRLSVFPETLPFSALHQSPLAYWFSWSLGAYTADCYLHQRIRRLKPFVLIAAFGLALLSYLISPLVGFQFMAVAILTMALIWQTIATSDSVEKEKAGWQQWPINHLIQLGMVSYSFYLIHQPFLVVIQRLKSRFEPLASHEFLALSLCLFLYIPIFYLSRLLFRNIEQPSARLGKVFSSNSRRSSAGGA